MLAAAAGASAAQAQAPGVVSRVSAYVERHYAQAQRVMADETVTIQPLNRDLTADGFARRLIYELRVEWDPAAEDGRGRANIVRQLVRVGSRAPKPDEEPRCTDPRAVSPEPLGFLLPTRLEKFRFTAAGIGRTDGREAVMVDYRPVALEPPVTTWNKDCGLIDLGGRTRGRVWIDPATDAVLRLDEGIVGMVDVPVPREQQRNGGPRWITVERADSSIRYRAVSFADPDETLLLPSRIETVNILRDSGSPRLRITQVFDNYRRFLTASRVVE